MMHLLLGALSIPSWAAFEIDQSYEPLGGESIFRTVAGAGLKQTTWKKTRITTSGSGWIPAGLSAVDTTTPLVLACVVPRSVTADFATRQATLPAGRRADTGCTPWGFALRADGAPVSTPLSLSGNIATLDAVAGAVAYIAMYLPQFTVWASRPTDSGTPGTGSYSWQLVCEEV